MVIDIELTLNRFGFGKISDNKFQFLFFRLSKWKIPNKHSISFEINWKKKENFEVKQNINNKQFILLLDGMMGSGKTTTSKFLSDKLPRTAIIGMDRVKRFISDFERGERDNTLAREIVFEMTKKYLDLGVSVIIDQAFKLEEIEKYENLAKNKSIKCYKFQLHVFPDIAYRRVVERQKDYEDKVPGERIKQNISLFNPRENMGFIKIDTLNLKENEPSDIIIKELEGIKAS